jgi:hypothetical protein
MSINTLHKGDDDDDDNNNNNNVLENENFKLYWNRSKLTDKKIHFNQPDITFMNKEIKNTFDRYSCPKYT